ncbi:MAG: hypothetical protein QOJ39_2848 [Candidatus Eremiobacteraeota bacterium]|nr:hypothetical protein [Candidatus Eremiobacteraeota bacterium]
MNVRRSSFAFAVAAMLLVSCGGGGGGSQPSGAPPTTQPASNVPVQLAIVIPQKVGSAHGRAPRYVSPATSTVKVSVNGGAAQSYPVANGAPCSSAASSPSGTCVIIVVNSPPGNDTFTITLLDASNNVLSQGSVQQNVVADQTNSVNINLNGSIAALRIALSNPSPPAGTPAKLAVTLLPVDAAGFTVVGAPGTLPNIVVTDSDGSGATGLYLAGADGTCNTQAASPSTSVTTTQSGQQYVVVCLNYTGAALASATIAAQIAGGPSASATLTPSASSGAVAGFWMMARGAQSAPSLERVDPNLVTSTAIAGSNADFGAVFPLAVAVEPTGEVEVVTVPNPQTTTYKINQYARSPGGNVAPLRGTSFAIPGPEALVASTFALDGQGNAYFAGSAEPITGSGNTPSRAAQCTIFRVPLTSGTVTPVAAANCVNLVPDFYSATAIHTDSHGRIYLGIARGSTLGDRSIFRFVRNADGSLTAESAITIVSANVSTKPGEDFAIDGNGNIVNPTGTSGLSKYPGSFVAGQNTTVSAIDTYAVGFARTLALDPSGNILFTDGNAVPDVIHAASHGVDATRAGAFVMPVAADTMNAGGTSGSSLSAQPAAIELPGPNTVTLSESGYTGAITETDNCANIATVAPAQGTGPSQTFTVSQATAGGHCTVTFADAGSIHTATLQVGSTVTVLHAQGRRR